MISRASSRRFGLALWPGLLCLLLLLVSTNRTLAQEPAAPVLVNGDFEELKDDGTPAGWSFHAAADSGYRMSVDTSDTNSGSHALLIDAREAEAAPNRFANLSQSFDAQPLRGKRVRFRVAVKVQSESGQGKAQLWFRVDRESTGANRKIGFFDNMQDRPITSPQWQNYDIVGVIDQDASDVVLGVLVFGDALVGIDSASLEVVDDQVSTTGISASPTQDPPQPFLSWWLALPIAVLALFVLAHAERGLASRIAFRFSLAYWVLYCFPTPISGLIPHYGDQFENWYETGPIDAVVRWTAAHVLGIQGNLVSPQGNGSGDTTFAFVQALLTVALAAGIAAVWSAVDWRKTDHSWLRDLLRSYLRYVLAVTMLGYGLAKLGMVSNQFPTPGLDRLESTFGESSPMGLAWTFLGSSRAYTFFAGAGEVVAAMLLIFRRTTLLGVFVATAVMANVVMLNFCYDIPVKLYSTHLLVMGLFLGLSDIRRLAKVFFWNRPSEPVRIPPPFCGPRSIWLHRLVKVYFVFMLIAWPCYDFLEGELALGESRQLLSEWQLREVNAADGTQPTADLQYLFLRRDYASSNPNQLSVVTVSKSGDRAAGSAVIDGKVLRMKLESAAWNGDFRWSVRDDELKLTRNLDGQDVTFVFDAARKQYLLMNRGFHWINERPLNR